jgi:quercetin dioxygenase-like cupin family protein
MTLKELKKELSNTTYPVIKLLHHGTNFKVLVMGFNKGTILKEHKAHVRSKLTVLEGAVIYKEANRALELMHYDEVEIPIGIPHSVEAIEDSLCLLTQG